MGDQKSAAALLPKHRLSQRAMSLVRAGAKQPQTDLERISQIIQNARATWFALLGALVFAGVTLASVDDISFFVKSEQTKLPLLGISVPVTAFFVFGAPLIAAIYCYFHLYLEQLWTALGEAEARIDGKPLADCIFPWLVSDAMLRQRDKWRGIKNDGDRASRNRSMGGLSTAISFTLVWLFGTLIIGWFWWRSMPKHDEVMTGWLALVFLVTLYVATKSLRSAHRRLKGKNDKSSHWPRYVVSGGVVAVVAVLTVTRSWIDPWEGQRGEPYAWNHCFDDQKKTGRRVCWENVRIDFLRPAPAQLKEAVFSKKPKGWLGWEVEQANFRLSWCKLNKVDCSRALAGIDEAKFKDEKEAEAFQEAWEKRQADLRDSFEKVDLRDRDLRRANLHFADLERVKLRNAKLQGANLQYADLQGADLKDVQLQGANLSVAQLNGAYLSSAQLQGSNLSYAQMQEVNLWAAQLQGASLTVAQMQGANLTRAQMQGADLSRVQMKGANLSYAEIQGADLWAAEMKEVNFRETYLTGSHEKRLWVRFSDLSSSNFSHALLRWVDFTGTNVAELKNFGKSFGDGSVVGVSSDIRPHHWCKLPLDDHHYFGRVNGRYLKGKYRPGNAPLIARDYPTIPLGTPCPGEWHPD